MPRVLTLLILLALLVPAACMADNSATIMVRPESEVTSPYVMMSDIAAIRCPDKALMSKLQSAQVCSSPYQGMTRRISRDQVMIALRKAGVLDKSVSLLCPSQLSITRCASKVSGEAIFDCARDYALNNGTWPGTVEIVPSRLPDDQIIPTGKVTLQVKSGTHELRRGQNYLPIEILLDGQTYRTVCTPLTIKVLAKILVSTKPIARGEAFNSTNVTLQERDLTSLPNDVITEEPSADSISSISVAVGSIIRQSWITQPAAVKSGDSVLVIALSGAVKVADKGTAIQDGRVGDTIAVRLAEAREVRCIVTEPGVVTITIGGRQ
jgi:flagella basal body P-ring formation protein FlgA